MGNNNDLRRAFNQIGNATRSVLGDEMDRQFKNAVRQTLNLDDGNNSSQYNFPEQNLSNNTEDNCLILSNTEGEIAKDIILTHPNLAEWEFSDGAAELVMAYSYKHPNVKKYGIGIVVDDGNEYFYHEDNVNGSYTDMSEENVRKALSNRFKMSVNVSFADCQTGVFTKRYDADCEKAEIRTYYCELSEKDILECYIEISDPFTVDDRIKNHVYNVFEDFARAVRIEDWKD